MTLFTPVFLRILDLFISVHHWVEMWQHRLKGHMVVTRPDELGTTILSKSEWATAIYTEDYFLKADLEDGQTIVLGYLLEHDEFFAEGA